MGLEKAIVYKKEYRKPYKGAKAIDGSCRNNKSCPYCRQNRTYNTTKKLQSLRDQYG